MDTGLSKQFWAEAVLAAVNIITVIPNSSTKTAPNELWRGKKCNLRNFKVFGCKTMVWHYGNRIKRARNLIPSYIVDFNEIKINECIDVITKQWPDLAGNSDNIVKKEALLWQQKWTDQTHLL